MKYIISESKLNHSITEYFDKIFPIDGIDYSHPYVDDGTDDDSEELNVIEYYIGDSENIIFRWVGPEFYQPNVKWRQIAPLVQVERKYYEIFNGYFGDLWKKPFKEWFEFYFDIKVKTVVDAEF